MIAFDFIEDYFEFIEGNKITIISSIKENETTYSFRYCLYSDFTETGEAEINKSEFLKWVKEQEKLS
jgi:hypothetical protein